MTRAFALVLLCLASCGDDAGTINTTPGGRHVRNYALAPGVTIAEAFVALDFRCDQWEAMNAPRFGGRPYEVTHDMEWYLEPAPFWVADSADAGPTFASGASYLPLFKIRVSWWAGIASNVGYPAVPYELNWYLGLN